MSFARLIVWRPRRAAGAPVAAATVTVDQVAPALAAVAAFGEQLSTIQQQLDTIIERMGDGQQEQGAA